MVQDAVKNVGKNHVKLSHDIKDSVTSKDL